MASLRVPGGEVCLPGDVSREVSSRVQPCHHLDTSSILFLKTSILDYIWFCFEEMDSLNNK